MKITTTLLLLILLAACNDNANDASLLKNQLFAYDSVTDCVTASAQANDYLYIEDVEVLFCDEGEGVLDQGALDELKTFTNLTTLGLGKSTTVVEFDGKSFPYLTTFDCYECGLITADISENPELESFEIWGNKYLEELDFSHNPQLSTLNLSNVVIRNLVLGVHDNLTEAYLVGESFTGGSLYGALINIDLTKATALERLEMMRIGATHLDLSSNTNLTSLSVWGANNLETIDISSQKLQEVSISDSAIAAFDTAEFTELSFVAINGSQIAYMNFDYNLKLEMINLTNNPLSQEMMDYLDSLTRVEQVLY